MALAALVAALALLALLALMAARATPLGAKPPAENLLLDALAEAQTARRKEAFSITATSLATSPPSALTLSAPSGCEGDLLLLSSEGEPQGAAQRRLPVALDSEEPELALLWIWLCEARPVTRLNELGAALDSSERAILVNKGSFGYRLGSPHGSHLELDLELERLLALTWRRPDHHPDRVELFATFNASSTRLVLSREGSVAWQMKLEKTP